MANKELHVEESEPRVVMYDTHVAGYNKRSGTAYTTEGKKVQAKDIEGNVIYEKNIKAVGVGIFGLMKIPFYLRRQKWALGHAARRVRRQNKARTKEIGQQLFEQMSGPGPGH